ncbi:flagellar biosynthetic protein FliO [Flagellatimonas centrodinii]|uniref:FliO/MopB family protein n=1 Tax=Flagellatimonas centrodinii TaxID=2806210 RepID=UPI001FF02278|nr:flagellar biosynthetic protein FliO [Flagellatimonas centrodinii]ULQ45649.1 flagellar biosynthetic protein FliO [Flagellatimonas centrodinii]
METVPAGPGLGAAVQMLVMLALVVGVILVAGRAVRRFRLLPQADGRVKVCAVQHLGPRQQLVLVEVEGDKVLVGVSPAGITRLWSRPSFAAAMDEVPS